MNSRLVLIFIVLFLPFEWIRGDDTIAQEKTSAIQLLLSDDASIRAAAKNRILEERKKMISDLIAIIKNPDNHKHRLDSVQKAIETLGEIEAAEAANVLIPYIIFPRVIHPDAGDPPIPQGGGRNTPPIPFRYSALKEMFPTVKALIAIGSPCIPQVIAKAADTENVLERKACVAVLLEVDRERHQTKGVLQAAIAKETDERRKKNLEWLLKQVTTVSEPAG